MATRKQSDASDDTPTTPPPRPSRSPTPDPPPTAEPNTATGSKPTFKEPYLPIKPHTREPIDLSLAGQTQDAGPSSSSSCVHRDTLDDWSTEKLVEYAGHHGVWIDEEDLLRRELVAILCSRNGWIPVLPSSNGEVENEDIIKSRRLGSPEDVLLATPDPDAPPSPSPSHSLSRPPTPPPTLPPLLESDLVLPTIPIRPLTKSKIKTRSKTKSSKSSNTKFKKIYPTRSWFGQRHTALRQLCTSRDVPTTQLEGTYGDVGNKALESEVLLNGNEGHGTDANKVQNEGTSHSHNAGLFSTHRTRKKLIERHVSSEMAVRMREDVRVGMRDGEMPWVPEPGEPDPDSDEEYEEGEGEEGESGDEGDKGQQGGEDESGAASAGCRAAAVLTEETELEHMYIPKVDKGKGKGRALEPQSSFSIPSTSNKASAPAQRKSHSQGLTAEQALELHRLTRCKGRVGYQVSSSSVPQDNFGYGDDGQSQGPLSSRCQSAGQRSRSSRLKRKRTHGVEDGDEDGDYLPQLDLEHAPSVASGSGSGTGQASSSTTNANSSSNVLRRHETFLWIPEEDRYRTSAGGALAENTSRESRSTSTVVPRAPRAGRGRGRGGRGEDVLTRTGAGETSPTPARRSTKRARRV